MDEIMIIENTKAARMGIRPVWCESEYTATKVQIDALLSGKQWALYDGESATFISMEEPE